MTGGYKVKKIYVGSRQVRPCIYKYEYDFRGKTLAQIQSDGWTSFDKTPSFDADGMYSSSTASSNDVRIKRLIPRGLSNATKITITLNYKWNNTLPGVNFGIDVNSDNSGANGLSIQGTYRGVYFNNTTAYSINNASDASGTYSETLVYDLVNKTYNASGHWTYSGVLSDTNVTTIKAATGLRVYSYKSNYIRVQGVSLVVEY